MPDGLYYLDAPYEKASIGILRRLQVSIAKDAPNSKLQQSSIPLLEVAQEHKTPGPVTYHVLTGEVSIELRDTADSWIHFTASAGTSISFPGNIFRRLKVSNGRTETRLAIDGCNKNDIYLRYNNEMDSVVTLAYHNYRELVCELCQQFFEAGWVTGTGGSISIRYGERIYMTPSGVQKERIKPDELYVLDVDGEILSVPNRKPGCKEPKLSDCSPLFLHAFQQRNAGAVLHSHAISCNLVTSIFEGKSEFTISHQEMIKGIAGFGYFDTLVIPIIENTAWEHELADRLGQTIAAYPKAPAVLVRRHGMYVWGDTWEQAKRHGECLHYLFEVAVNMFKIGKDFNCPPILAGEAIPIDSVSVAAKRRFAEMSNGHGSGGNGLFLGYKHYLFDIEGTTTPITFVKDTLFPFAANAVSFFLETNWGQYDLSGLWALAKAEKASNMPKNPEKLGRAQAIDFLASFVKILIANDSKASALKNLQGDIWRQGYGSGEIKSVVYDDVPGFFQSAVDRGAKVSIYSSGSRQAQHLLFKHSNFGDLRNLIAAYFDTSAGTKREASSYANIALTLGADKASEVLFVTDILEEAQAASAAGLHAVISLRPGNASLPAGHGFKMVHSFAELP